MKKLFNIPILFSVVLFSGCAVNPINLNTKDIKSVNAADRAIALKGVKPIGEFLSLDEAIARALKYNLEQRMVMLEYSLAASELKAAKYDMLPRLLAKAGYDWRNNYSSRFEADYSDPNNIDKTRDTNVSREPSSTKLNLSLSWSLLDFGASYYTARQNADKLLVANEKRRSAIHTLLQNVRTVYWKAVASDKLGIQVRNTIQEAEAALVDSQKLSRERVGPLEESLRYQRNLLENLRLLESVERELASARIELTKLIGALPGAKFKLVEPEADLSSIKVSIRKMEAYALVNNGDLRVEHFNARIAAQETRKAILKLLPGLSFDIGTHRDSDTYLVNDSWNSAGISLSYNLFNLLSASAHKNAAEKNENLAQARRMALQMALLARLHLATHQYDNALRQYKRAGQINLVDTQLEQIAIGKLAGDMGGKQRRISANVTSILSNLRCYQAMSKFQDATGQLQSSLGMDPYVGSIDTMELSELAATVDKWLKQGVNSEALAIK